MFSTGVQWGMPERPLAASLYAGSPSPATRRGIPPSCSRPVAADNSGPELEGKRPRTIREGELFGEKASCPRIRSGFCATQTPNCAGTPSLSEDKVRRNHILWSALGEVSYAWPRLTRVASNTQQVAQWEDHAHTPSANVSE